MTRITTEQSIFRPQSLTVAQGQDEILLSHPRALSLGLASLTVLFVVAVVALIQLNYQRKETVQGFIKPESELTKVTFKTAGEVTQVLVKNDDFV